MATITTPQTVEQFIVDAIVELGPAADEVSRASTFQDLDVDSLDLVELSQMVEDQFGVKLQTADVASLKTVGDVVDLVVGRAT